MPCSWKRRLQLTRRLCLALATNGQNTEVEFVGPADYGVCSSKALKYFGCKFHSVVSLTGIIMGFLLTPASRYDNQPVVELLAPAKVNQPPQRSKPAQRQLNRLRLLCETVNAQVQEQLHLSKHYAKSI